MSRKIVVGRTEYRYVVGKNFVKIVGPDASWAVPLTDIKGLSGDLIARGRRKQTTDGMVTPAEIAAYIKGIDDE